MSKFRNNLIADKLESLDFLPHGYQPNLNSKWALIEETISERVSADTGKNFFWTSLAACILVLLCSVSLWMYLQRTIVITVHQTNLHDTRPVAMVHPVVFSQPNRKKPVRLNNGKHLVEKDKSESKMVFDETSVVNQPGVELMAAESKINQPVARIPVSSKSTKQRYIQVDFDDESASIKINKPAVFAQTFRLKIGIINSPGNADNSTGNPTVIKLRQNF